MGFWTGDPNIFPTGEGQLGTTSTLGPETPANLGTEPVWMQMGCGGGAAFPSPSFPVPLSLLTPDCTPDPPWELQTNLMEDQNEDQ